MADGKIIFFDIDGTLFGVKEGVPKDTAESIRKLKKNGHIPVICTGRTKVMLHGAFLEPGFDYIIGGAGTYIEMDGKEEFCFTLPEEEISRITVQSIQHGFSPILEGKEHLYLEYDNEKRNRLGNKLIRNYRANKCFSCVDINETEKTNISKVSAVFTPESDLEGITKELEDKYVLVNHRSLLLEMIPREYSKATGIEYMIKKLDIPREDTYAFGDSFNDLEMLQYVKYGVCMGNSDKNLFQYTDYRTDDFDKGGITNALIKFGLI